ncbi:hypothetical protein NQ315_013352 [Exocentrus adspersus]|uniref:DUF4817 domain-containing protein n=1 Tax=Exocentrus adspersus TaxID=1586481 RepID=A0AAV8VRM2_9CUCU|nr:hypothetical protein NQ315_013352 [Exocentrus adspersus]
MVLSEKQRIDILILLGFEGKIRSQAEVCALFNAKYPENQISQGTVKKTLCKMKLFSENRTSLSLQSSEIFTVKMGQKLLGHPVFHKFEEHGTVHDLPRIGRARALNEKKKLDIALELLENPHTSTVSLARNHDAPRTTIRRFLKQEKYHPYKVYLVQELLEDDYDSDYNFVRK